MDSVWFFKPLHLSSMTHILYILYSLFNLYWVAGRWADLVSVGIPPSCPQCNPEGCCKTRAVLQTVSIRSNNSGKFSLRCPGSPGETETHKVNLRLKLGKCCICEVVFFVRTCRPGQKASRDWNTGMDTVPLCIWTHRYQSSKRV